MEAVRKLDHQHPDVFRHRHNHLSHGLGLRVLPVLHLVELGHTINEHANLVAKIRFELVERVLGILHRVMQQCCCNGDGPDPELCQDLRHCKWMSDVGLAAVASLSDVRLFGDTIRPFHKVDISFRVVLAHRFEQCLQGVISRRPREQPGKQRTQAGGRRTLNLSHCAPPLP